MEKLSNLTPAEARASAELGECIALPGWKDVWFWDNFNNKMMKLDVKKNKVVEITEDPEVSNEWFEAELSKKQYDAIDAYFKSVKPKTNTEEEIKYSFGEITVGFPFEQKMNPDVIMAKKTFAGIIDFIERVHKNRTEHGEKQVSWSLSVFRTAAFNAILAADSAIERYLNSKA